jgi:hypothetical protein
VWQVINENFFYIFLLLFFGGGTVLSVMSGGFVALARAISVRSSMGKRVRALEDELDAVRNAQIAQADTLKGWVSYAQSLNIVMMQLQVQGLPRPPEIPSEPITLENWPVELSDQKLNEPAGSRKGRRYRNTLSG